MPAPHIKLLLSLPLINPYDHNPHPYPYHNPGLTCHTGNDIATTRQLVAIVASRPIYFRFSGNCDFKMVATAILDRSEVLSGYQIYILLCDTKITLCMVKTGQTQTVEYSAKIINPRWRWPSSWIWSECI